MTTFARIIERAQGIIGEVAGPGVQVFAEDRMLNDAVSAFNLLFTKYGWPEYVRWSRHELDGSTGLVTDDNLSSVRAITDFLRVCRDGEEAPISIMSTRFNPYSQGTGSRVRFWDSLPFTHASFATKRLQFYPITAQGVVNVRARIYPVANTDVIIPATVIHLDEEMMVFATAFFTLAFEDLNVGAADTCKNMMEMRYKDIINALASHETSLLGSGEVVTDWTQLP